MDIAQYYHYGPMMDGGDWFGGLLGLLFFIALVALAIYAIRAFTADHRAGPGTARDPLDIARERYAKGEITKEELAEIKAQLQAK